MSLGEASHCGTLPGLTELLWRGAQRLPLEMRSMTVDALTFFLVHDIFWFAQTFSLMGNIFWFAQTFFLKREHFLVCANIFPAVQPFFMTRKPFWFGQTFSCSATILVCANNFPQRKHFSFVCHIYSILCYDYDNY
jgi:hypothetical protein